MRDNLLRGACSKPYSVLRIL